MFRVLSTLAVVALTSELDDVEEAVLLQTQHQVLAVTGTKGNESSDFSGCDGPVTDLGKLKIQSRKKAGTFRLRGFVEACTRELPCMMAMCMCPPSFHTSEICEEPKQEIYIIGGKLCIGMSCKKCKCDCQPQVVAGRPFTSDEGNLLATTSWSNDTSIAWIPSFALKLPSLSVSSSVAKIAADHWQMAGEHEHASVASFSRASLDLMRFGAPPELLRDTHIAAQEEVAHSEIAFGLASFFHDGPESLSVGAFPLDNVKLSNTLDDFAAKLMTEGCMGETGAVAALTYAIQHVSPDSPVAKHLTTLRDEEAKHAALAWNSLVWALSRGAAVGPLREIPHVEFSEPSVDSQAALALGGVVPAEIKAEIERAVQADVVTPWLATAGKAKLDFPAVSSKAKHDISDAVDMAGKLIRSKLKHVTI